MGGQTVAQGVQFDKDVKTANGIILGNGSAAVITSTFDTTAGAMTIGGKVNADATATANVVVQGGHTATTNTAWGGDHTLNLLTVTGTSTNLTLGGAVTSTNTKIGSGATITTGANNLTSIVDGLTANAGTLAVTGNSTVSGNIGNTNALSAATVATGDTLTAQGAVYKVNTTTLTNTAQLTLSGAAVAVTGNIVSGDLLHSNAINVTGGTVTMVGDIGTSTTNAGIGTIAISAGDTLKTTGNVYANAVTAADNAGHLQFNGTSAQVFSGTYQRGILDVGVGGTASNVTFNGILGAGTNLASINVNANATATFNANVTSLGALANAGTLKLGYVSDSAVASQPVLTVNSTTATDGAYSIGLTTTTATSGVMSNGKIVSGGALSMSNAASTLAINVDPAAGYIASNSVSLIARGVGQVSKAFAGASDAALHSVTSDNSSLYSFQYVRGDYATAGAVKTNILALEGNNTSDNDIILVATRVAAATLGSTITTNDSAVDTALVSIGTTGTADVDTFQGKVASAATATAAHNLYQSVTPTVDGGAQQASLSVGSELVGMTDTRIASVRDGNTTSGVAAGVSANGSTLWLEGYGQYAKQKLRSGVDGYDSNTWGGVIGADTTALLDKAVAGIAFNYGRSKVDSNNVNTTATDLDNYGVTFYGNYDLGDKMFVNGQLGYAYNNIDTARHNVGGVVGQTASGSTNSDQYSARADVGRDYAMDGDMTLTPDVSAAYTYIDTAGYTETGAGGLNQVVGSDTTNVLNLGVGATASWKIKDADDNLFKPALHVGYAYDAIGDKVATTSSFTGAPAVSFTTTGAEPARSTFDVGAKLIYATRANWDVSATYDFQVKQDYTSHTGQVRATAHF